MVAGETLAVSSGGTVRAPWPAFYSANTLNDVAMGAGETPAVVSGGTVRAPWPARARDSTLNDAAICQALVAWHV